MRYHEPDFLPWDGRRVPMTFIAGYLGAGKTTLINRLLAQVARPIAVLVNDVGEVNIDARLIRKRSADTIELTDGCVCCSISDGFGSALDHLRERPEPPDQVVVELSGVSLPHRMLPWSRSAGFALDGVVTALDVEQFSDRMVNPVSAECIRTQVADADLVVLTKVDLVAGPAVERIRAEVEAMAPATAVYASGDVDIPELLALGGREASVDPAPPTLFDRHITELLESPEGNEAELLAELQRLPHCVVRAKGIARTDEGAAVLLQRVGRRCSVTPLLASEVQEPTPLVVISVPD